MGSGGLWECCTHADILNLAWGIRSDVCAIVVLSFMCRHQAVNCDSYTGSGHPVFSWSQASSKIDSSFQGIFHPSTKADDLTGATSKALLLGHVDGKDMNVKAWAWLHSDAVFHVCLWHHRSTSASSQVFPRQNAASNMRNIVQNWKRSKRASCVAMLAFASRYVCILEPAGRSGKWRQGVAGHVRTELESRRCSTPGYDMLYPCS
jgi:hypothetical protein